MRETPCKKPCSPEAGHIDAIILLFAAAGGSPTAVLSLGPCAPCAVLAQEFLGLCCRQN